MSRLEIIILNNVKKYSIALGGPSDDETLPEKICAQHKEVIKLFVSLQAYQTFRYNKFYCN